MRIGDVAAALGDPGDAGVDLGRGRDARTDRRATGARGHPREHARGARGLVGRYRLVAVVSGRTIDEATSMVAVAGVSVAGLYGLDAPPLPERVAAAVEAEVEDVPGAWVERKGASVAVHMRQAADPDAAEAALRPRLGRLAAAEGLELQPGKRVLELVPADRPRKGAAVERLVREARLGGALYAGDDQADLEAFHALSDLAGSAGLRAVRVAVHGDETPQALLAAADLVVEGTAGMADLLRSL